jgi:hypothetical protein
MKFLVSLTTTPYRINLIEPVILNLVNQTIKADKIILNVPEIFYRSGEIYIIPDFLSKYPIVINKISKDYGPATKLVGSLEYMINNNYNPDYVIILDDDIKYPINLIEYYKNHEVQDSIRCITSFNMNNDEIINSFNKNCGICEAFASICIKTDIIKNDFIDYINNLIINDDCKLSDDILINNYFYMNSYKVNCIDIDKQMLNLIFENLLEYHEKEYSLHGTNHDNNNYVRYLKCIDHLYSVNKLHIPLYSYNITTGRLFCY